MVAVTPRFGPSLQRVNRQARPYPAHLLPEGGTALALFAARWLGHNDAIHFARKDMIGTCVDTDNDKLREMEMIYPPTWRFRNVDAWDFALGAAEHGDLWDAVSADTFTGSPELRSLKSLDLWCALSRRIVTVTRRKSTEVEDRWIPPGWRTQYYERSSEVDWLVLTRG